MGYRQYGRQTARIRNRQLGKRAQATARVLLQSFEVTPELLDRAQSSEYVSLCRYLIDEENSVAIGLSSCLGLERSHALRYSVILSCWHNSCANGMMCLSGKVLSLSLVAFRNLFQGG